MSEARFDILFDGTLKPNADPQLARERLGAAFKLDAAGVERLFTGKPVAVKRDADLTTAARYKRVFEEAGAIVTLRALESADPAAPTETPPILTAEGGFEFLEEPPKVKMPDLDLSHLSLVGGTDWSLADCDQPPEPVRIPDISHLALDAIEPTPDDNDPTGQTSAP